MLPVGARSHLDPPKEGKENRQLKDELEFLKTKARYPPIRGPLTRPDPLNTDPSTGGCIESRRRALPAPLHVLPRQPGRLWYAVFRPASFPSASPLSTLFD